MGASVEALRAILIDGTGHVMIMISIIHPAYMSCVWKIGWRQHYNAQDCPRNTPKTTLELHNDMAVLNRILKSEQRLVHRLWSLSAISCPWLCFIGSGFLRY